MQSKSDREVEDSMYRLVKIEVRGVQQVMEKVMSECFQKCVEKATGTLTVGEMTCVDRCVPKYVEAHHMIQKIFSEHQQQQLEEQQRMLQAAQGNQ